MNIYETLLAVHTNCLIGNQSLTLSLQVEMIAVEFDTAEAAEDAVKKLADNNNWRSTSKIELLRPRAKTPVAGLILII